MKIITHALENAHYRGMDEILYKDFTSIYDEAVWAATVGVAGSDAVGWEICVVIATKNLFRGFKTPSDH